MESKNTKSVTAQIEDINDAPLDLNTPISVHLHNLTRQDFREQFIEDHFHCCLCGSELEFTHVSHFVRNEVKEEASCACCQIKTRTQQHTLQ